MPLALSHILASMEAAGKRVTPQRRAICQVLVERGGHPTAAELLEQVRLLFPIISQATVYNTLDTLQALKLVQELNVVGDEHAHYELNLQPHLNIVCTSCGRIVDMYTDTLDALLAQTERRSGYLLDTSKLLLYGHCPDCRQQR